MMLPLTPPWANAARPVAARAISAASRPMMRACRMVPSMKTGPARNPDTPPGGAWPSGPRLAREAFDPLLQLRVEDRDQAVQLRRRQLDQPQPQLAVRLVE